MLELSRRDFLGSAAAAAAVTYLPTRAEAAGFLSSHSRLPWISGAYGTAPDTFAAWRGRKCDMLLTYTPKDTWSDIANETASNLYWFIYQKWGAARQETVVVSYPLFPDSHNPRAHGMSLWSRAA